MCPQSQTYHPHQVQEQGMEISRSKTVEHNHNNNNLVLTWVVVMLKANPQAAVNPRAAAEAIATMNNPI